MFKGCLISVLVLYVLFTSDANHIGHNHIKMSNARQKLDDLRNGGDASENQIDAQLDEFMGQDFNEEYFSSNAALKISKLLQQEPNTNQAQNVIIFVTDDMPASALRQLRNYLNDCQPNSSRDKSDITQYFSNIALARNRCADTYAPDGACSTTAIVTGVKTNSGTISVARDITQCTDNPKDIEENRLSSILTWAQEAGKRTGIVTTSKITDPNVSPTYAQSCNSAFETDADIPQQYGSSQTEDIASQLFTGQTGRNLNVMLGGGRENFISQERGGVRDDSRNLIREFIREKRSIQSEFAFITDMDEMSDVCVHSDHVLGLFNEGELDPDTDPNLNELVETGLILLDQPGNDNGYVLYVQQANQAKRDAEETGEIDPLSQIRNTKALIDAVETAYTLTDPDNTLIIVTSNYVSKNVVESKENDDELDIENDDLEPTGDSKSEFSIPEDWEVEDFAFINLDDELDNENDDLEPTGDSKSEFSIPEDWEVEDFAFINSDDECRIEDVGEDSFVMASGPWAHLFSGLIDQEMIAHFAAFAACIGDGITVCDV